MPEMGSRSGTEGSRASFCISLKRPRDILCGSTGTMRFYSPTRRPRPICGIWVRRIRQLEDKNVRGALEALYQVDNNKYAFQFDDQVYRYFTEYVMNQEKERLQWGAGRIVHHLDLSKQIRSLMEKERTRNTGVEPELEALKAMERQALGCFDDDIRYMIQAVDTLTEGLRKAKEE